MPLGTDTIRGVLKLEGKPDCQFFTGWQDFIQNMSKLFAVEIPNDITNVTIGQEQPSDSERDHLWFRTDSSGGFAGLYLFGAGAWQKVYPLQGQVFLMYGNSLNIPTGYTLAENDPNLNSSEIASLKKMWVQGGDSPSLWYSLFHVTFTGF
jgi:hypothetical protein